MAAGKQRAARENGTCILKNHERPSLEQGRSSGAGFRSTTEAVDTTASAGNMVMQMARQLFRIRAIDGSVNGPEPDCTAQTLLAYWRAPPMNNVCLARGLSVAHKNQYQYMNLNIQIITLALPILLASCASYGPCHPNTSAEPLNSVRGPMDGRYKLAFIEFGDQGSALDTSQRAAALGVVRKAKLSGRCFSFTFMAGTTTRIQPMSAASSTALIPSRVFRRSLGESLM